MTNSQITWLTCGFEHCVVLTEQGKLASWGYGASGCLGHGDFTSFTSPQIIAKGLEGVRIAFVEAGGYHNAAVSTDGELYTWGRGDVG
jgi:alpha-tubulin suppressor-like RCC1 family protein